MTWTRVGLVGAALLALATLVGWWRDDLWLAAGAVAGLALLVWLSLRRWRRRRRRAERRPPPRDHIPAAVRRAVYQRDAYACRYCGRKRSRAVKLELDHFHPVVRGGTDHPDNLVTACRECNRAKGARDLMNEPALRRFIGEREVVASALARAHWRRARVRELQVTAFVLLVVLATYLALTRLVW